MLEIFLAIAPIFLLILLGYGLRRGGFPGGDFWEMNDKFVYWLLFPALLFFKTSTIDLTGELVRAFAVVIYSGFFCSVGFALVMTRLLGLPGPAASSVVQGAARHNSFVALAVAERLYGGEGLALAALIAALLIPMTNITVVTLMVTLVKGGGGRTMVPAILRDLARNPLLIAVAAGILVNLSGLGPVPVLHDLFGILGAAALPVMLLGVGANLRVRTMAAAGLPTLISGVGKMLIFPLIILLVAPLMGLTGLPLLVALVFGAVPTAASGYTLARQMGGDAPLMAAIITLQTAVAIATLPLTLTLATRFLPGL